MRRSLVLVVPMLLLAACGAQEAAAPTLEPTTDTGSVLLPMDATSTTDSPLPVDATPTFELVLLPEDATPTDSVLLPVDSTPLGDVALLPTDANASPTSALVVEATPTLGLQPGTNFDATPTPEALMSQSAPADAQAGLGPDTISADVWRSTQTVTDGQDTSRTDLVGNTLTVFLPTGWNAYEDTETFVLANYDYSANPTASLTDTRIATSVFVIPNDLAPLSVAEGFEPSCPLIVANFLDTSDDLLNGEWGQILLTSTDNQDGAIVNGTNNDDDALIACVQLDTGYGMVIATSEQGRMTEAVPFIVTLVRSLAYGA